MERAVQIETKVGLFVSNIGQAILSKNNNGLYEWVDIQLSDTTYKKDMIFSCDILP